MGIVCRVCKRLVNKGGSFTEDGRYVCFGCWLDNPPKDDQTGT